MQSANSYFWILIFFLFLVISCQKTTESLVYIESTDTIKYEVEQKADALSWSTEIDPERLAKQNNNSITKDQIFYEKFSLPSKSESVIYPTLLNFYPLDLSILSSDEIDFLDKVASSIQEKQIDKKIYNQKYSYLHVVDNYIISDFPDFSKWIIGKPFILQSENKTYQVPVRFFSQNSHLDLFIITENIDDKLFVNQFIFGDIQND